VSKYLAKPTILQGDAGDDLLRGTNDLNLIVGGPGDDILVGGSARDLLIGDEGQDVLTGYDEEDLLVGVVSENSQGELQAILDSWASTDSRAQREADVRGLIDLRRDAAEDLLFGGNGDDLVLTQATEEGESPGISAVDETGPEVLTIAVREINGIKVLASNPVDRHDVNGDGHVTPLDALVLANDLNRNGARLLDEYLDVTDASRAWDAVTAVGGWDELAGCLSSMSGAYFVDVTMDATVSPLDLLQVINRINSDAAYRGDGVRPGQGPSDLTALSAAGRQNGTPIIPGEGESPIAASHQMNAQEAEIPMIASPSVSSTMERSPKELDVEPSKQEDLLFESLDLDDDLLDVLASDVDQRWQQPGCSNQRLHWARW